jgi:hypothetical protein
MLRKDNKTGTIIGNVGDLRSEMRARSGPPPLHFGETCGQTGTIDFTNLYVVGENHEENKLSLLNYGF